MHRERTLHTPRHRGVALFAGLLLSVGTATAAGAHEGHAGHETQAAAAADPNFAQVPLAKGVWELGEPMSIAVLPDRSVLHTSRSGTLRLTNAAGITKFAGQLDVYTYKEEGLQGVAVDPNFEQNRAIYLYYAPLDRTVPEGEAPEEGSARDFEPYEKKDGYRLSRFVLKADGTLDKGSEKTILTVPSTRGTCCHVGGDLDFDAQGNLYLSTGDNSSPGGATSGYAPIDERANRNPMFDAQRTAANTNDLRGKILRIKVAEDGSGYTVPDGNLFPEADDKDDKTRPEIYAMGLRNPFRMSVDQATGTIYVGDYGPDATGAAPNLGPAGTVEFDRITKPGNYGWPYCVAENQAYIDRDLATGGTKGAFDCAAPKNESPRNTGRIELPKAEPAWIWYSGNTAKSGSTNLDFGQSSEEGPMAGPVYRYDANLNSPVKFPKEYDGDFFAGEFSRRWIKNIKQGADGAVQSANAFPWSGTSVMDMDFGPDGALYVLDYGTKWFGGDDNSALYRIENTANGHTPVAEIKADKGGGGENGPLKVTFSSEGTSDADGGQLTYAWDFGDGGKSTEPNPSHTYEKNGVYSASVTVKDGTGREHSASMRVIVGPKPTVKLQLPREGQLFKYGDEIPFKVEVNGPEGQQTACAKVEVSSVVKHNRHGHPATRANGCEGTLRTPSESGHGLDENVTLGIAAKYNYTLPSGEPYESDDTTKTAELKPRQWQAEHYSESRDVKVVDHGQARGGKTVGSIRDGSWVAYRPYNLSNATKLTARVSSAGAGGTLEVRAGAADGKLLGSAKVPVTGGWEKFTDVSTDLNGPPAEGTTLYLVFKGESGKDLFELDDFEFTTGAAAGARTGAIKGVGGKCLDVAGGNSADGTQVQLYGCGNNNPAQAWTLPGDGTVRALGKCLDVKDRGTDDGTKVQLFKCNDTPAQVWEPQGDGTVRNPHSAKCLDADGTTSGDGTRVHLWTCHAKSNQQWTLP
ncbi:PQQ-dependent sugar dehydrogenase [Streptomyces sp. bgisy027]|uniref:PQQ-dependent sugar dehydrogenase n=1 Tax=Streptomyces sp. bgisy027 TaxID=3413770 RepID=UPI003D727704